MKTRNLICIVFLSGLFLVLPNHLQAGHLPTKSYTTFDGLANDSVNKIVRDSRGFLWFCTGEGLSRFDGFEFKNYTQNEGLPSRNINDFLETKDGDFLIATTNGLAAFNPNGAAYRWNILTSKLEQTVGAPPMFRTFLTPNLNDAPEKRAVLSLTQSPGGRIFAGTGTALYQLEKSGDEWIFHQIESESFNERTVFSSLQFDADDYLWIAANSGIYRMSPENVVVKFAGDGGSSVLVDTQNRVWVGGSGTDSGLRLFTVFDNGKTAQLTKTFRKADGLPLEKSMAEIKQLSDGRILVLVGDTLCEFLPKAAEDKLKFRIIARGSFQTLAEDSGGNLWLGTVQEGAWKLFPGGFVKYDASDGIPAADITSLFTNSAGELFITSGKQEVLRFTGGRFESVIPNGLESRSWGIRQLDLQAANGDWWISSTMGLRLYPKSEKFADLGSIQPKKIYTAADGLYSNEIASLFEDSRGDIWITTINEGDSLQRWEQATGKIIRYSSRDGLPKSNGAVAFSEDSDGNLWLGFYFGGLARYKNGKFQFFTAKDGIPEGSVNSLFCDKNGRLWIATSSRGVFRTDNPSAENPQFVNLSTTQGLSSNRANCLTEDNFGQVYVGTGRGVDRIEPNTGNVKLYTQTDGLPGNVVLLCRREENGALWFVSRNSLVKLVPQPETALKSPPVYIGGITINGAVQKISELGAENVGQMDFASYQRQIKIDFFALGFGAGDRLRYQYKLGNQEWSEPDEQKSVTFDLGSGNYQFSVRAINADGVVSDKPAVVSFTIESPFWKRWWFLLLATLLVGTVILTIERYRAARLRELKDAFGKLSVSENRFRQMIEQSPLGTVIFAPDGSLRAVNRAYEDFWGIRFEQIKNWDLLADEQLNKKGVTEKLRRVFLGETVTIPPTSYDPQTNSAGVKVDKNAEIRWIQSFAYPVKTDAGELLEVILVMEDVTDTKRADEIVQNARSERLRELEQVRRRIAADLHDDIGSSLTQISIWSEVLQRDIGGGSGTSVSESLRLIGNSSRELVDTMSDIVWAINPQKDFLSELSGKMRRFASDVFTARNIDFTFDAPDSAEEFVLGANVRREVYLIFKEAVNNIVKHASCTIVEIELSIENTAEDSNENSNIRLCLRDNGIGFDASRSDTGGHGLPSMKARAKGLDGTLELASAEAAGTIITLVAPLGISIDENLF